MQQSHNVQRKNRLAWLFRTPTPPQQPKFYYGRRAFVVPQDPEPPRRHLD